MPNARKQAPSKYVTPNLLPSDRLAGDIDRFFVELGQGVNVYALTRERARELKELDALDDLALLRMGLTRSDIPRRVFKDLFG